MDEAALSEVVVVDGASVATTTPGRVSLARLESGVAAMRAALPSSECIVFVDSDMQGHLSEPEAIRLEVLVERGLFRQVAPDSKQSTVQALLTAADEQRGAVLTNSSFHTEVTRFPWLLDDDRLISHSYGGDGWWVFMTRTRGSRWSWTGQDTEGPAIESLHTAAEAPVGDAPEEPETYADLIRSASHGVAIVPYAVVRDAVAIVFEAEDNSPRDSLVFAIVSGDLGLTVYGAAALLYRFERAGIVNEVEAGRLELSPDLDEDAAVDQVAEDILHDLVELGHSSLGHRDTAAARRALGLPTRKKKAAKPKRPAKKAPAKAKKAASTSEAPAKKAPAKAKKAPAKKVPAKKAPAKPVKPPATAKRTPTRSAPATSAKAPAKKKAPASKVPTEKKAAPAKAAAKPAAAKKQAVTGRAPAQPAAAKASAPARAAGGDRPRVRTGARGTEWVARCSRCGFEIVAPDRATAASELAAHPCPG